MSNGGGPVAVVVVPEVRVELLERVLVVELPVAVDAVEVGGAAEGRETEETEEAGGGEDIAGTCGDGEGVLVGAAAFAGT